MTSPSGVSIIAVSCHTVDGQRHHKPPGKTPEARDKYKAQCARNIVQQMVQHRTQGRASASSQGQLDFASSQGQPRIIICGDLNVRPGLLQSALQDMKVGPGLDVDTDIVVSNVGDMFVISDCGASECVGLPHVKSPDNQHDVGFFDVSVAQPCKWSSTNMPGGVTDIRRNKLYEQTTKAQQSSSRGSSYNRCRRAMAMVAAMMATLVGQGRPWSTRDDQIQLWSTLSDQGRPSSTRVDPGRAGSTLVDQRRSVSTRVDHGRPGSTLVDPGRPGWTLVDQDRSWPSRVDFG